MELYSRYKPAQWSRFLLLSLAAGFSVAAAGGSALRPTETRVAQPRVVTLLPEILFRSSFEDGEPGACGGGFDADADGLMDDGCIVSFVPPDPAAIAPPNPPNVATDLYDSIRFLFDGPNPVQRGVDTDLVKRHRVAVLRGRVTDGVGAPLGGVLVRNLRGPRFGYTYTRADGRYDFVVNGGGEATLDFQKNGYLRAQRTIRRAPLHDFAHMPDLGLVQLDANVSTVQFAPDMLPQWHQGGLSNDLDGTRRATVFFPRGTTAQVVGPGGGSSVPSLHIRATEFTVGALGRERMPGALPATSAYTYAVEISADEVSKSQHVEFNKPIAFYVDNFLTFPVGVNVPVGYYDFVKGEWRSEKNGRVVKLLSVSSGKAVLDVTGSGTPATQQQLDDLGLDNDELETIAGRFSLGQSFWRMRIAHLTPIDCNWAAAPPPDATKPPHEAPEDEKHDKKEEKPKCEGGSVIECENRVLRESIPIAGTGLSLNYQSDRQPLGRGAWRKQLVVSGSSIPASVKRIVVRWDVGGQQGTTEIPAAPDQTFDFAWDGKDVYGREVEGSRALSLEVGYVYDAVYADPANFDRAWAAMPTSGVQYQFARSRNEITIARQLTTRVGKLEGATLGFGGWGLSAVHSVDPDSGEIRYGDGGRGTVSQRHNVVQVVSGRMGAIGSSPVGQIDARDARYGYLTAVAAGPDGSSYLVEGGTSSLWHVDNQGIQRALLTNAAPYCTFSPCAPNPIPSTSLTFSQGFAFNAVVDVAAARDGCVYASVMRGNEVIRICNGLAQTVWQPPRSLISLAVADDGQLYGLAQLSSLDDRSVIYRFDPDAGLSQGFVLAGTNTPGCSNAAAPAQSQSLCIDDIAAGPNGALYFSYQTSHTNPSCGAPETMQVRRLGTDGALSVVGNWTYFGCTNELYPGGNFSKVAPVHSKEVTGVDPLYRSRLAVDRDGIVYFSNTWDQTVRTMTPAGDTARVTGMGYGQYASLHCNGNDALATCRGGTLPTRFAYLDVVVLDVDVEGGLLFAPSFDGVVARIAPKLRRAPEVAFQVADPSGSTVDEFDVNGRHLYTRDAVTSHALRTFQYSAEGWLTGIADDFGNTVSVTRNAFGVPGKITAPDGQETSLAFHTDGNLASVSNPLSEIHQMAYGAGGSLSEFRNPRNKTSVIGFAADDGLLSDQNAAAGGWIVAKNDLQPNGRSVTMTSALGRTRGYTVKDLPDGSREKTTTAPDGAVTTTRSRPTGGTDMTMPDGSVTARMEVADPRFGTDAPTRNASIKTPAGLTNSISWTRTATLANRNDKLSHTSLGDTMVANGRTYSRTYNAATRTWTMTSPVGRQSTLLVDDHDQPVTVATPGLASVNYSYDARGRLYQIVTGAGPDQRVTTIGFSTSGFVDTLVDPMERMVLLNEDAVGRTVTQTLPDARQVGFTYDENGNIATITPPSRPSHGFEYTPVDLLSKYTPPSVPGVAAPETTYQYNADKQLELVTRPDGLVIDPEYSTSTGRLDSIATPLGAYSYSFLSGGRLSSATAPGTEVMNYSWDGPLLAGVAWSGPVGGSVGFAYDNNFWLKQLTSGTTASGNILVEYGYDNDGLLTSAKQGSITLTLSRSAQNGLLIGTSLGAVTDSWTYNTFGEPIQYVASYSGTERFKTVFERDKLGRITKKTETIGGVTTVYEYTYDLAGRLDTVKQEGTLHAYYAYDSNSNRTGVAYGAAAAPATGCAANLANPAGIVDAQDRLTSYGHCAFTYTANGERASKVNINTNETTQYQYDVFGNLRHVTLPNGDAVDYVIDGQNRRVGKKVNGILVQGFLYLNQLKPVAELDGAGNVTATFVYADRASTPSYILKAGNYYRVIADQLGSPRLVINVADGTVAQRLDYDEWGSLILDTNPGFLPFGFAGGIYDAGAGLVRFGVRDFDPIIGRWTAKDPASFFGGPSFYQYANDDPTNATDSTGLWSPGGHDAMLQNAFQGRLPQLTIDALKAFGRHFDKTTQSKGESFKHAMRSGPTDDVSKIQEFIDNRIREARRVWECEDDYGKALQILSEAFHPMMDRLSPMHTDEYGYAREWNPHWPFGHTPFDWMWTGRETVYDIPGSAYTESSNQMNAAYDAVFSN